MRNGQTKMEETSTEPTEQKEDVAPAPYKSRVDTRPLTAQERAVWWVMGAMGLFSLLLLVILLALSHSSLAAN